MEHCGIYKITNLISRKCYIGLSKHIEIRWKQHLKMLYKNKLYCAMKKYGIENFKFEIIEECSEEELEKREQYWISYYDSYNNGYNMTKGGDGIKGRGKAVEQYDIEGNFIARYETITEATLISEAKNISQVCLGKKYTSNNFQWFYENEANPKNLLQYTKNNERAIEQYDIEGNFIEEYKNITEAVKKYNTSLGNLRTALNNQGTTAKGFQWKYKDDERKIESLKNKPIIHNLGIIKYDLNDNVLEEFKNLIEIKNKYNYSTGNISAVCNGKRKTAYGFKWKYKK